MIQFFFQWKIILIIRKFYLVFSIKKFLIKHFFNNFDKNFIRFFSKIFLFQVMKFNERNENVSYKKSYCNHKDQRVINPIQPQSTFPQSFYFINFPLEKFHKTVNFSKNTIFCTHTHQNTYKMCNPLFKTQKQHEKFLSQLNVIIKTNPI